MATFSHGFSLPFMSTSTRVSGPSASWQQDTRNLPIINGHAVPPRLQRHQSQCKVQLRQHEMNGQHHLAKENELDWVGGMTAACPNSGTIIFCESSDSGAQPGRKKDSALWWKGKGGLDCGWQRAATRRKGRCQLPSAPGRSLGGAENSQTHALHVEVRHNHFWMSGAGSDVQDAGV